MINHPSFLLCAVAAIVITFPVLGTSYSEVIVTRGHAFVRSEEVFAFRVPTFVLTENQFWISGKSLHLQQNPSYHAAQRTNFNPSCLRNSYFEVFRPHRCLLSTLENAPDVPLGVKAPSSPSHLVKQP